MIEKLGILVLAVAAIAGPAVAGEDGEGFKTDSCAYPADTPLPGSSDVVLTVPSEEHPTIQSAVSAASPGDTVLVGPGVYNESVEVTTDALRIRGTDRAAVRLDGGNTLAIGINVDGADGVVIENMTAHNYVQHGFYWTEAKGYWARYLTAYNNGLYGVYAYDARCGQIDHSYASGNADSGFYIGECFPCDAVIHDIVAEENALGYSGTNAGGDLVLRDSIWRNNALGIVPNSLDSEERPPQRGVTIKHNVVSDNGRLDVPGVGIAGRHYGAGIVIAGGQGNQVYGNTVTGHPLAGIALVPLPSDNVWIPGGNTIWGNTVSHDADAHPDSMDLAQAFASAANNCWADNTVGSMAPAVLQDVWSCAFTATPPGGDPRVEVSLVTGELGLNDRVPGDWKTWPAPTAETAPDAFIQMPAALTGPITEWLPAVH